MRGEGGGREERGGGSGGVRIRLGKRKRNRSSNIYNLLLYMYTVHFYALKHGATAIKLAVTKPLGWLSPCMGLKNSLARQFGARVDFHFFRPVLNVITIL